MQGHNAVGGARADALGAGEAGDEMDLARLDRRGLVVTPALGAHRTADQVDHDDPLDVIGAASADSAMARGQSAYVHVPSRIFASAFA